MASVARISRPDVVALIKAAAKRFTEGDETEVVALALCRLQEGTMRTGSLFGVHKGSVIVRDGVDLMAPIIEDDMDLETGRLP